MRIGYGVMKIPEFNVGETEYHARLSSAHPDLRAVTLKEREVSYETTHSRATYCLCITRLFDL